MWSQNLLAQARKWLGVTSAGVGDLPSPVDLEAPAHADVGAVLAPHSALLRRIRAAYGYPDDLFESHLLAPIRELASWLHFLPGHPGGGFEHPGGAIEQALTNCLFSLQAADGRTFDGSDTGAPSTDATQRWRLACALGGLFASLREIFARIEVASDEGNLWPVAATPLLHWLRSLPAPRYRYRWTTTRDEDHWLSIYVASRCLEPALMAFLASGDGRIAAGLLRSIGLPNRAAHDPISEVVNKIALAVAARDRAQDAFPPASLLALTLKRLLGTSDWLPNSPGGHVWFGADGLYLLWPDAGIKLLESMPRNVRGTPDFASHGDLLRHMALSGIICASPSSLFKIRLPGGVRPLDAVRITDPHRILKELGVRAAPFDAQLGAPAPSASTSVDGAGDRPPVRDCSDQRSNEIPEPSVNRELFAEEPQADCMVTDQHPSHTPHPPLLLDSSRIVNQRSRQLVDEVVRRLEQGFDTMLSKIVPAGVFIALTEFVGQLDDGASIVRALHDAGLLAIDKSAPNRRVHSEWIEGADVAGIVLSAAAFHGYPEWVAGWQEDPNSDTAPSVPLKAPIQWQALREDEHRQKCPDTGTGRHPGTPSDSHSGMPPRWRSRRR
jgi:hypothetical protein